MDRPTADHAPVNPSPTLASADPPPLTPAQFAVLSKLSAHLPARWVATRRRRRFLFLALAAPGFFTVFATPLHRQFFLMIVGLLLFGAATLFRVLSESLFLRADAAELWPFPPSTTPASKESRHA
jgi:hypothetical protein